MEDGWEYGDMSEPDGEWPLSERPRTMRAVLAAVAIEATVVVVALLAWWWFR